MLRRANNATSLLAGSIDASVTTLSVTASTGSRFPTLSDPGDWFPLVVVAADGFEIMRATARTGDVITVLRGQEGTSARAFTAGDRVDMRQTKAAFDETDNRIAGMELQSDTNSGRIDALEANDPVQDAAIAALQAADTAMDARVDVLEAAIPGVVPVGATMEWDGPLPPSRWLFKYGQAVSRSTYAALFAALTATGTATTANGSATLSSVSVDFRNYGLIGAKIEGAGIPAGATIIAVTINTIGISANATGNNSNTAIRIFPHGNGDGSTTFNIPDDRGRVRPGRDTMGGTAASRLTGTPTGGVDGSKLGNAGGEQGHVQTAAELVAHLHALVANESSLASLASNRLAVDASGISNNSYTLKGSSENATLGQTGVTGASDPMNVVQPSRVTNTIIYTGVL